MVMKTNQPRKIGRKEMAVGTIQAKAIIRQATLTVNHCDDHSDHDYWPVIMIIVMLMILAIMMTEVKLTITLLMITFREMQFKESQYWTLIGLFNIFAENWLGKGRRVSFNPIIGSAFTFPNRIWQRSVSTTKRLCLLE